MIPFWWVKHGTALLLLVGVEVQILYWLLLTTSDGQRWKFRLPTLPLPYYPGWEGQGYLVTATHLHSTDNVGRWSWYPQAVVKVLTLWVSYNIQCGKEGIPITKVWGWNIILYRLHWHYEGMPSLLLSAESPASSGSLIPRPQEKMEFLVTSGCGWNSGLRMKFPGSHLTFSDTTLVGGLEVHHYLLQGRSLGHLLDHCWWGWGAETAISIWCLIGM